LFQEFFEDMGRGAAVSGNRYVGTVATIAVAAVFTFTGTQGALWPLFGSANQLLASLTLLAITVWLAKMGKGNGFVKYPMYFMFCVTLTALGVLVYNNILAKNVPLIVMSVLLLGVAVTLVVKAMISLRGIGGKPGTAVEGN
jgi:carbon starvation protein